MKSVEERAGWISAQIENTLAIFGEDADVEGYVHDFMDCLDIEIVNELKKQNDIIWIMPDSKQAIASAVRTYERK